MNALMICLIASALAAFGGRWFLLARAMAAANRKVAGPWVVLGSAALAAVAAGWMGGTIAAEVGGPGMLLFLSLALLFAGAAMLWPAHPPQPRLVASARGPMSAFILLLAAMLSDSAPFIILAAAAWSGETGFAIAGGIAGLMATALLALYPSELPLSDRMMQRLRRITGVLNLLTGTWTALTALGLL